MRAWVLTLVLVGLASFSWSCFRQVKETVTEDSVSYVTFQGTGEPVTIRIDGQVIAENVDLDPDGSVRYKISRGTHTVEVVRREEILVNRQIYFGEDETRIVTVPGR
jgi:hypothetical protein